MLNKKTLLIIFFLYGFIFYPHLLFVNSAHSETYGTLLAFSSSSETSNPLLAYSSYNPLFAYSSYSPLLSYASSTKSYTPLIADSSSSETKGPLLAASTPPGTKSLYASTTLYKYYASTTPSYANVITTSSEYVRMLESGVIKPPQQGNIFSGIYKSLRINDKQSYFINWPRIGFKSSYRQRTYSLTGNNDTVEKDEWFSTELDITTDGWLWNPNFMRFNLLLSPEYKLESKTRPNSSEDEYDSLSLHYRVGADFFYRQPLSFNIYLNNYEENSWQAFSGNTNVTTNSLGVGGDLATTDWLGALSYNFFNQDYNNDLSASSNQRDSNYFNAFCRYRGFGESYIDSRLTYNMSSTTYRDSTINYDYAEGNLLGIYYLKPNDNSKFNLKRQRFFKTDIEFYNQTISKEGPTFSNSDQDTDITSIRLLQAIRWRIHKKFTLNGYLSYKSTAYENTDTTKIQGEAELRHRLYDNLYTVFQLDGSRTETDDSVKTNFGSDLDLSYSRKIPLGRINLSTSWSPEYYSVEGLNFSNRYSDSDFLKLSYGESKALANEGVEISSIVVTNSNRTIFYVLNRDYRVLEVGSIVYITLISSGNISEGQEIIVSYRYSSGEDPEWINFSQNYKVQYSTPRQFLTTGYSLSTLHRSNISGETNAVDGLSRLSHRVYGTIVYKDLSRTHIEAQSATNYLNDSERNLLQWRLTERLTYQQPLVKNLSWNALFYYSEKTRDIDGLGEDDIVDAGVSADVRWKPRFWCDFMLLGFYNYQDTNFGRTGIDTNTNERERLGGKIQITLRYRIWSLALSYSYTEVLDNSKNDELRVDLIRVRF